MTAVEVFATGVREAQRDWRRLRLTLRAASLRRRFGSRARAPRNIRRDIIEYVGRAPLTSMHGARVYYGGHLLDALTLTCRCGATKKQIAACAAPPCIA